MSNRLSFRIPASFSAIATLLLLGACASTGESIREHRNPQLSGLAVTPQAIPEASNIDIPMPAPALKAPPKRAEAASLWQADGGFFGDQRAARVGDILTVLIDINDEAELSNKSSSSRSGGTSLDSSVFLGLEKTLSDKLGLESGPLVDLSSQSSARGNGAIGRSEQIRLKVAAMIVRVLDNGNLVVAGRQEVKVNNEMRELRVAGIIRPADIEMNNSIPYDRIAEARITYGGKGQLSQAQQPRYGAVALDAVLPY